MFLSIINEVIGVARCQTMHRTHHCYRTSPCVNDRMQIFFAQVDGHLHVISSEAETRPWNSPRGGGGGGGGGGGLTTYT